VARLRTWQEQGVVPLPENASQVPGPQLSSLGTPPIWAILETNIPFVGTGMSFLREGWDMFKHRLCLCKVDSDILPKKTSRPT
jgi:hypothetical protein